MAGAGYKLFNTGDVLTAAQVNTYLQEQVVMVFANATARTTALSGVLAEGMVSYLKDTDALEIYSGSAWIGYGSGDITGITTGATSGLTGGVTSGTADLKLNTTAKGGLLVGTGSGTVSELTVGSNTHVLTADSTTATGLKWAAAASGGGFTSLASGSLSGSAVTISSISSAYTDLYLIISAPDQSILLDDDSGNNFDGYILESSTNNAAITTVTQLNTGNIYPSYNGVGTSQVQIVCYIYNYANTTARKIYNLAASGGNNCDSAQWVSRSTAAVSQLSINAAAGSFAAGTYTLYGVK